MDEKLQVFVAYPSKPPLLAETIREAATRISAPDFKVTKWEDLRVGGKVIISEILRNIDDCDIFIADVTGVNANVMFELGYAIGVKKRIWLTLDGSRASAKRDYEQFRLLVGVGYRSYVNSQEIVDGFFYDQPYTDLKGTLFANHIEPMLGTQKASGVLYLKGRHETDADRKISEAVERNRREGLPCIIDDPKESRVQPLAWYAQNIYSAQALLAHFCNEEREDTRTHNARQAFVCGIATGFSKRVFMLAESDYTAPLDYKDLLINYSSARDAGSHAEIFLHKVLQDYQALPVSRPERSGALRLAVELKSLRIGDYIAENESETLTDYFVGTTAYQAVLDGQHAIYVGRKGSGKTANFLQAAYELKQDKRNLVVVIQPVGYDLSGLTRLLKSYRERDAKGFVVDSLWKFLIYSDIGQAAASNVGQRSSGTFSLAEQRLLDTFQTSASPLVGDFAIRLERALEALQPVKPDGGIESTRTAVSEALHMGMISELRQLLGEVLGTRERVAVLIDNLDKAWVPDEDLGHLSELILGLLTAAPRMPADFARSDSRRKPVNLTLSLFLRSDIFHYVVHAAREPDKLSISRIIWEDPESLLRILDVRLLAAYPEANSVDEVWHRFFTESVREAPTRDYLASRTLPRPRDLLYLAKAAVSTAINRGHSQVLESDITEAEKLYSHYALDTIETEATASVPDIERVLYEFIGAQELLDQGQVRSLLRKAGVPDESFQNTIDYLIAFSFLGIEIRDGQFAFATDENEFRKNSVLARNLQTATARIPRYKVHRAFHAYLEIESDRNQGRLFA